RRWLKLIHELESLTTRQILVGEAQETSGWMLLPVSTLFFLMTTIMSITCCWSACTHVLAIYKRMSLSIAASALIPPCRFMLRCRGQCARSCYLISSFFHPRIFPLTFSAPLSGGHGTSFSGVNLLLVISFAFRKSGRPTIFSSSAHLCSWRTEFRS